MLDAPETLQLSSPIDPSAPVNLVTTTKFMRQYRTASAISGVAHIAAAKNKNGQVELFTTDALGAIFNIYPDSQSDTGYRHVRLFQTPAGFHSSSIAVAPDADNMLVAFAISEKEGLYYSRQTGQSGAAGWSDPQRSPLANTGPYAQRRPIVARQIGGQIYIATYDLGASFNLSWSAGLNEGQTWLVPLQGAKQIEFIFAGSTPDNAQYIYIDDTRVWEYIFSETDVVHTFPIDDGVEIVAATSCVDRANGINLFVLDGDGAIARMSLIPQTVLLTPITSDCPSKQLHAVTDAAGAIHLLALGTNGSVYHLQQQAAFSDIWSPPAVLIQGATEIAICPNDAGDIELFAIDVATGGISHLIRQSQGGNWETSSVQVPDDGVVENFISYSTDVGVQSAQGNLIPNCPVQISTTSETIALVNGQTFLLDAQTPAMVTTNAAGMLSVTQQTDTLGVAPLTFHAQGGTSPVAYGLRQSDGIGDVLGKVTGPALLAANNGTLIKGTAREGNHPDQIAQALRKCMTLASSTRSGPGRLDAASAAGPSDFAQVDAARCTARWDISFSEGAITYRDLSDDSAIGLDQSTFTRLFLSLFESIGDFLENVVAGLYDVVKIVVDGAKITIYFLSKEGKSFVEFIIKEARQAFDVAEIILQKAEAEFIELFKWLGHELAWDKILLTHEAINHLIGQAFVFVESSITALRHQADDYFDRADQGVVAAFSYMISQVGTGTIKTYFEKTRPVVPQAPAYAAHSHNNPVFNAMMDNPGVLSGALGAALHAQIVGSEGPFGVFFAELKAFAAKVEGFPEFQTALDYLERDANSPEEFFQNALDALLTFLEGISRVVLAAFQTVVDALFDLVTLAIQAFAKVLQTEITLPLVSKLYRSLTNSPLTLADLFALIIAIPTTAIYRLGTGAMPFSTEAQVAEFKSTVTAQLWVSLLGLGAKGTTAPADLAPDAASWIAKVQAGIGIGVSFFNMLLIPIADAEYKNVPTALSAVLLFVQIVSLASSAPLVKPDSLQKADFIFEVFFVILSLAFFIPQQALPEYSTLDPNGGPLSTAALALFTLIVLGAITGGLHLPFREFLPYFLSGLSTIANVGLAEKAATATEGISVALVVVIDAFTLFSVFCFAIDSFNQLGAPTEAAPQTLFPALI